MKALILFVGWCILFVLCWPLALLALILFPVVWLLTLPFRLIGITFEALLALVRAVLMLPARLLGWRRSAIRSEAIRTDCSTQMPLDPNKDGQSSDA